MIFKLEGSDLICRRVELDAIAHIDGGHQRTFAANHLINDWNKSREILGLLHRLFLLKHFEVEDSKVYSNDMVTSLIKSVYLQVQYKLNYYQICKFEWFCSSHQLKFEEIVS